MNLPVEIKEFLTTYLRICLLYNMQISSCGCCNSPFITVEETKKFPLHTTDYIEDITVNFTTRKLEFDYQGEFLEIDVLGNIVKIRNSF